MSEDTDGASARAVCAFIALGEDTLYQVKVLLHSGEDRRCRSDRSRSEVSEVSEWIGGIGVDLIQIVLVGTHSSSCCTTTDAQTVRPYRSRDRASLQRVTRLCPLRLSGRRGLHSEVLELLGVEATYLSLALVHLSTGVLYIYVCGVLVEVGTLLRCDE